MKQALLALAVGAALTLPFAAHAEGAYIGLNVGSTDVKVSSETNGSASKNETAYKLYGGYGFSKYFAVEGGYIDFGKATVEMNTDFVKADAQGVYAAAVGILPISAQFSLFAKAGVSANRMKITWNDKPPGSDSGEYTKHTTSPLIGIGAAFSFTKNLSLVAEYEDYGKIEKEDGAHVKATVASIGLRYNF